MSDLIINPRFKNLLRPLNPEEYGELEASIVANGVREPIRIWREQIVDGHNRHEIATKHGLDYAVRNEFFNDEDEVCLWIIDNQLGRRNITDNERLLYIGQKHELETKLRGGQSGNQNASNESVSVGDSFSTAAKIAQEHGVSESTVYRAAKIAKAYEAAPSEIQDAYKQQEITQSVLIDSLKPLSEAKPKKVGDGKHDNFTEGMAEVAKRLNQAFARAWQCAQDLETICSDSGLDLRYFAPNIASLHAQFSEEKSETWNLRNLERCPLPSTDKHATCAMCGSTSYIINTNLDDNELTRRLELAKVDE